jgi:hypothetical protein
MIIFLNIYIDPVTALGKLVITTITTIIITLPAPRNVKAEPRVALPPWHLSLCCRT